MKFFFFLFLVAFFLGILPSSFAEEQVAETSKSDTSLDAQVKQLPKETQEMLASVMKMFSNFSGRTNTAFDRFMSGWGGAIALFGILAVIVAVIIVFGFGHEGAMRVATGICSGLFLVFFSIILCG